MNVRLDQHQEVQIEALARKSGRSIEEVLHDVIEEGLSHLPPNERHADEAYTPAMLRSPRLLHAEQASDFVKQVIVLPSDAQR